ncbi:sigma-70 family RNA polymerase sigma factor [Hymenobacter oligotrophus]|uniref:Sigma-70 family RNA polymerase sigma factor n=1 Tax=Hymenobacter oligotrophus TaxID=2319843 RepID=A0A3B7QXH5_9BACT|nr:sigma-70 family RNA polymerase sigma factor [Hymenobacter oligotrophus]AYA36042.1 sigma-70 family RNA polymerase sigma factor [Hymenobacter oligotrophus]
MKQLPHPHPAAVPDAAELRHALLRNRQAMLAQLYRRAYPVVRQYVLSHGGSATDAKDVFQDALVVFYEKAVAGTLHLTASASTYLVAVSRNLWRRELARRRGEPLTHLADEHGELPDAAAPADEQPALAVREYVERLGERCKSILLAFYYFRQPLEQIAAAHQYGSVRSATVQKFKCLERLRQSVRQAVAHALTA